MAALGIAKGIGATVAALGAGLALYSGLNARRAERRVPRDGRMIAVDGAELHYVDMGSGPPIVLVHGLGGQLRNFTYSLTERLVANHRVIVVDRPGAGYSRYVGASEPSLSAQARLIARFIEKLGLDRPLLVGHSLGGALSLSLALQRPDLIGGLALIAPLTQPVEGTPRAFAALAIPSPRRRRFVAWTFAAPVGKLTRGRTQALIFGPDPVPDDFDTRGGGALTLRPSAFFAASSEVAVGSDELIGMAKAYPALKVPLGILFGRGDRILPAALHGEKTAASVPGAEIELIDGGHMIPLTAPDACAAFIERQAARMATA